MTSSPCHTMSYVCNEKEEETDLEEHEVVGLLSDTVRQRRTLANTALGRKPSPARELGCVHRHPSSSLAACCRRRGRRTQRKKTKPSLEADQEGSQRGTREDRVDGDDIKPYYCVRGLWHVVAIDTVAVVAVGRGERKRGGRRAPRTTSAAAVKANPGFDLARIKKNCTSRAPFFVRAVTFGFSCSQVNRRGSFSQYSSFFLQGSPLLSRPGVRLHNAHDYLKPGSPRTSHAARPLGTKGEQLDTSHTSHQAVYSKHFTQSNSQVTG